MRKAEGMIATPWPASAMARSACGARHSNTLFGGKPASGIKVPAHRKVLRRLEQRMRCEAGNVDLAIAAKPQLRVARRQHLHRRERMALKTLFVRRDGAHDRL